MKNSAYRVHIVKINAEKNRLLLVGKVSLVSFSIG